MSSVSDRRRWFEEIKSAVLSGNSSKAAEYLYYAYSEVFLSVTSQYRLGTNVYEREWDALIVLDSCRVDAMQEVAPEYDFIDTVDSIWSVGSTSPEWYVKTFVPEYADQIAETAFISANPNAEATLVKDDYPPRHPTPFDAAGWDTVSAEDLAYLEMTRKHDRPYDDVSDVAPSSTAVEVPSYVTDRTIVAGRDGYEKLMIHYFQPHRPFMHDFIEHGDEMSYVEDEPYKAGRKGMTSKEKLWPLYLDNLRLVLDSIEVLLENLDAERVAITADHGELLGELDQWGHFQSIPHPQLKRVPWVETTATDKETRHPDEEFAIAHDDSVQEQLADLGYL